MANGYIKAAQIIADDQTQVATKIQELIDAEGIDAGEINNFTIETFGANKFLIAILYAALRSVERLTGIVGLKVTAPRVLFKPVRSLTTKTGLKASFRDLYKYYRRLTTKVGLVALVFFKLNTKLSSKVGLKTVSPSWSLPFINRVLTTTLGFSAALSYVWHDIDQSSSLSSKTGLKASGQALYNGVLPNIPIG